MFVMVCGGALIMMVGVVVGVKMLGNTSDKESKGDQGSLSAHSNGKQIQEQGEVIQLELQEIGGEYEETRKNTRQKSTKTAAKQKDNKPSSSSKTSKLSAEEREMLARMGGNLDQNPSAAITRRTSTATRSTGGSGGGLKAKQLSKVVSRGKQQLQRCYEAALRSNPTDETIRLDIDLTVGMSGTVTMTKIRGKSLGSMQQCIKRIIRMWRFPNAGDETRTSFPVVFQPGA